MMNNDDIHLPDPNEEPFATEEELQSLAEDLVRFCPDLTKLLLFGSDLDQTRKGRPGLS